MKLNDNKLNHVKTKEELTRQIIDPLCECSNEFKDSLTNIVFKAILLNEDNEFKKAEIEWMYTLLRILQDCTALNEMLISE